MCGRPASVACKGGGGECVSARGAAWRGRRLVCVRFRGVICVDFGVGCSWAGRCSIVTEIERHLLVARTRSRTTASPQTAHLRRLPTNRFACRLVPRSLISSRSGTTHRVCRRVWAKRKKRGREGSGAVGLVSHFRAKDASDVFVAVVCCCCFLLT
jgi:hypothetical protein